jgi:hypothetical protein
LSGDDIARFTPHLPHAERVLHLLQGYYRERTTEECRNALAIMYGHEHWDALETVMHGAETATAFDEDVGIHVVGARFQQQYDAVLTRLAGITDESMVAAQALDQEVFAVDAASINRRYRPEFNEKRLERARFARSLAYARQVVLQIRPSAKESAVIPPDRDDVNLSYRIDLVPRALNSWLAHHRPLLRPWGERIGAMEVRQHATTDLLNLSYTWGEACLDAPAEIPKPLQLYPIVLSAKWYAWVACSRMLRLQGAFAVLRMEQAAEAERRRASTAIAEAMQEEEARFILAQPREDFRSHSASAREQHIHAGYALVRRWMDEAATRRTVRHIMSRSDFPAFSPAASGG